MWLDDLEAIATNDRREDRDPREAGPGHVYVCRDCHWRDRGGALAYAHMRATGHRVRGRDWPESWPDCAQPTKMTR